MTHRQDLAGVRPTGGVEGLAKTVLVVEVGRGEEFVHIGLLLDSDAVFGVRRSLVTDMQGGTAGYDFVLEPA